VGSSKARRVSQNRDGRALSHSTLAEIRQPAVERIVRDGDSPELVIKALGFHRSVIYEWLGRFRKGGMAALEAQPVPGRPSKLGPKEMQRWREEEYPAIQKLAKQEDAVIYFGDEAGIRSDHPSGTTWAPQGMTPVARTTGSRFGMNLISAFSAKGLRTVARTMSYGERR